MKKLSKKGFTLIELLTVISIIAILSALVLSTAGYVNRKAATSRAQTEIKAIEAACESYKADNGTYPMATGTTDTIYAIKNNSMSTASYDPSAYKASSLYLYGQLSGDTLYTGKAGTNGKSYMEFKPSMVGITTSSATPTSIVDPFGYSYGYSTAYASTSGSSGYNPTFDLWSTAGTISISTSGTQAKWIKNW